MRSSFAGLNMAMRALMSQQQAIDVVNHNIGNANTEGFSRQTVRLSQTDPLTMTGINRGLSGQVSTGVQADTARRVRDSFIDLQISRETQTLGQHDLRQQVLGEVELAFNEPSDQAISAQLANFWNAWSSLSNTPESLASRKALEENTKTLTTSINQLYGQLTAIRRNLDDQIKFRVLDINNIAGKIAKLNGQITKIVGTGDQPKVLLDRRNLLLDELSRLSNIRYFTQDNGAVTVTIGGRALVMGEQAFAVSTVLNPSNNNLRDVVWEDDQSALPIDNGELQGILDTRDNVLATQIQKLDTLATSLRDAVNTAHAAGFGLNNSTNNPFFEGNGASDLRVAAVISQDLSNIAAATQINAPGDGSNALNILALQSALSIGGVNTIDDFYHSIITQLGVDSQQSGSIAANQTLLVGHLKTQRESVSGVSLDEEATNLVKFQHAYNAAARMMNVVDEMLDRIINGMGLVGRS